MTNFWDTVANSAVVVIVVACLFCFTYLLQDAKRKRQSGSRNWSEEWMNEESEGELLTLKLAGKVCVYIYFSWCLLIRTHCKMAGNNNNNTGKICHTFQGSKLDCPITTVCVRVLTKKYVNKWDAKQNEFLHDDVVRWWWVALFETPLVFQLCSIIDTVIRQLTERLTKRCLPHTSCRFCSNWKSEIFKPAGDAHALSSAHKGSDFWHCFNSAPSSFCLPLPRRGLQLQLIKPIRSASTVSD